MPFSRQASKYAGSSSLMSRGLKVCKSSSPSIGIWTGSDGTSCGSSHMQFISFRPVTHCAASPPFQHTQGAQGIPAAGQTEALHFEVSPALVGVLQRPTAILAPTVEDN